MTKKKTKKIVSKRFRVTKNGKVLHRAKGGRHLRRNKSKSRQRRQDKMVVLRNSKQSRIVIEYLAT